jgi:sugar O-acyltransferase (sialic acid O-acetyltransferase NeuD family)
MNNTNERVILFGDSAAVQMAFHQITGDDAFDVAGFTLDKDYISNKTLMNLPVVAFESVETVFPPDHFKMLIPISYLKMNTLREKKYVAAKEKGYAFISHMHPSVITGPGVEIGENCLIGPYTVIQPYAKIGNNVMIRDHCHIGHDSQIQDHCFIAGHTNVSGKTLIKSHCFLGAGSIIKHGLTVGTSCLIGAGVTLLENTDEKEVYMNRSAQKIPFPSDRIDI